MTPDFAAFGEAVEFVVRAQKADRLMHDFQRRHPRIVAACRWWGMRGVYRDFDPTKHVEK